MNAALPPRCPPAAALAGRRAGRAAGPCRCRWRAASSVSTFDADGRVLAAGRGLGAAGAARGQQLHGRLRGAQRRAVPTKAWCCACRSASRPAAAAARWSPARVARIFTGAPVPAGADAVVMQEDCEPVAGREGCVACPASPEARPVDTPRRRRRHARRHGALKRRAPHARCAWAGGQYRHGPAAGGDAAAGGAVFHRRRTGDAGRGARRRRCGPAPSTTPTVFSCARCCCAWAARSPTWASCRTGATPRWTRCAARPPDHDLILTSGGVSVGEEDHIKPAVQQLGSLDLWQIAIKPGKPFAYGKVGARAFHRPAGQPGVQLRDLPGAGAAFPAQAAGRQRTCAGHAHAAAAAFRLAARRQAPRVPARAAQCGRRPRTVSPTRVRAC